MVSKMKKVYDGLVTNLILASCESAILADSIRMLDKKTVTVDKWEAVTNESGEDYFDVTFE